MSQMISLWRFACKLYSQPTAKNAYLQLQDNSDVNVPLLLASCWLAQHQCVVPIVHVTALQAMAKRWNDHCIQPLRVLRQQMKTATAEEDTSAWSLVREEVKAAELFAEQQLLQKIEAYIQQQILSTAEKATLQSSEQWVDHVFTIIVQCSPTLARPPQVCHIIADIILSVVPASSQMSYDAVLERISQ